MHASRCVSHPNPLNDLLTTAFLNIRWAIPVCLFFCWIYMGTKYHWTQILVSTQLSLFFLSFLLFRFSYDFNATQRLALVWCITQGVLVCVGGLGMLVGSDVLTDKNWTAVSKGKGDAFMILGATLYGLSKCFVCCCHLQIAEVIFCVLANATEEFFVRRSPLYEVKLPEALLHPNFLCFVLI